MTGGAGEREAADVEGSQSRRPVDVAVGVLIDAEGRFLLTSRPEGKVYAGWWEFPGGKLEAGESVEAALRRELHEELGITIGTAEPWNVTLMDYAHARVRLHFCKVRDVDRRVRDEGGPGDGLATAPGRSDAGAARHAAGARLVRRRAGLRRSDLRGRVGRRYTGSMSWLDEVKWDRDGLVPAIAQEVGTNDVLMLAFMNREALQRTVELGEAVYWSRSRNRLWHKGEESGNVQKVRELRLDCDNDVVLVKVEQTSREPGEPKVACHTGRHSCFFQRYADGAWHAVDPVLKDPERIYR